MRKLSLYFSMLAALSALLLCGCARQAATPPVPTPVPTPITPAKAPISAMPADVLGRAVTLKSPAKRAVVLGPGAIEIVYALGAQERLIGRDDYADFPPAARKVAVAGNYLGPGVEAILALQADLVVIQGEGYDRARIEKWQTQIGAPVAVIGAQSVAAVGADITRLGAWLGARDRAAKLSAPFAGQTKLSPDAPTAFVELGRSPQLYTAGQNTLIGDALARAGFANAAKIKGYQAYNLENLVADNPRYYIVPSKKSRADELKLLRAHPTLSKLEAIRAGRVIVVNADWLLRPGPRLNLGIEALRMAIRPPDNPTAP